jgi:hypothetical protein
MASPLHSSLPFLNTMTLLIAKIPQHSTIQLYSPSAQSSGPSHMMPRTRVHAALVTEMMSDHFLLSESVWRLCTRELLPRRPAPPPYLCGAWKVSGWSPDQIWYLIPVTALCSLSLHSLGLHSLGLRCPARIYANNASERVSL